MRVIPNFNAVFSSDRQYRYALHRKWWENDLSVVFIGLNPSTAAENRNDHTISKLMQYSKLWGYGSMYVVNLFAKVSTDPNGIYECDNPVGTKNDDWIRRVTNNAVMTIAMWGNQGNYLKRNEAVLNLLGDRTVYCFGKNLDGSPTHPLRLSYGLELEVYSKNGVIIPSILSNAQYAEAV